MSTKSAWETRVGLLLKNPDVFAWAFKPPDGRFYGGQARIDWLACGLPGDFWMVEVKFLPENRRSLTVSREVSPGQQASLDAVAGTLNGVPALAVGVGSLLYVYEWRRLRAWQSEQNEKSGDPDPKLPLSSADIIIPWHGPKSWESLDLWHPMREVMQRPLDAPTATILLRPGMPSGKRRSSASTSKPRGSTPTPDLTLL